MSAWELSALLFIVAVLLLVARVLQVRANLRARRRVVAPPVPPPAPPVSCPACQTPNPATNHFCSACGASLASPPSQPQAPAADTICPSCATANPPGQVFCGQCGTRLAPAAA